MNTAQRFYFKLRHTRNVIPKARQLGFTTFHCIDYLDDCLFEEHPIDAAIIADTLVNVRKIFEKVKLAWDLFPLQEAFTVNRDNANEMFFSNGSSIRVTTDARSGTYQRLHISELAKIDRKYPNKAEDLISGSIPTVPIIGGKVSIESTGRGNSGYFYEYVKQAREIWNQGREPYADEFKLFFFPWTMEKRYEIEYGELDQSTQEYASLKNLTENQARFWQSQRRQFGAKVYEEYPTDLDECFIVVGDAYFDTGIVDEKFKNVRKPIETGQYHKIWENPVYGKGYILGVDVAEGYGGDHSVIQVIRRDTGEQVYEYCSNTIKIEQLAKLCFKIGKWYNFGVLAVERNNHGLAVITLLKNGIVNEFGDMVVYPNLYREKTIDRSANKSTFKLGWYTDSASKPLMLDEMSISIENDKLLINSVECLLEIKEFTNNDLTKSNEKNAKLSRHFDRVMALAICWQMRKVASGVNIS